ncbi:MAG: chaperone modulator CbpM [Flavobacteriales bacterium]|nr:chaperone modulator CbpM [Flavobacteriales bacterium]
MTTEQLIAVEVFASHQGVEPAFVHALHERGLIRITVVHEQQFLEPDELARIEQLARMHYDLDINLEGLEAISHLLDRMGAAQQDLRALRERLRIYEVDQP